MWRRRSFVRSGALLRMALDKVVADLEGRCQSVADLLSRKCAGRVIFFAGFRHALDPDAHFGEVSTGDGPAKGDKGVALRPNQVLLLA